MPKTKTTTTTTQKTQQQQNKPFMVFTFIVTSLFNKTFEKSKSNLAAAMGRGR
jgi:hypothetical protein